MEENYISLHTASQFFPSLFFYMVTVSLQHKKPKCILKPCSCNVLFYFKYVN